MRFSVVLVFALSIARPAHSQQPSTFDLPIQEHVYPNGMRMLVHTSRFGVSSSMNFAIIPQQEVDIEQAEAIFVATLARLGR